MDELDGQVKFSNKNVIKLIQYILFLNIQLKETKFNQLIKHGLILT